MIRYQQSADLDGLKTFKRHHTVKDFHLRFKKKKKTLIEHYLNLSKNFWQAEMKGCGGGRVHILIWCLNSLKLKLTLDPLGHRIISHSNIKTVR